MTFRRGYAEHNNGARMQASCSCRAHEENCGGYTASDVAFAAMSLLLCAAFCGTYGSITLLGLSLIILFDFVRITVPRAESKAA